MGISLKQKLRENHLLSFYQTGIEEKWNWTELIAREECPEGITYWDRRYDSVNYKDTQRKEPRGIGITIEVTALEGIQSTMRYVPNCVDLDYFIHERVKATEGTSIEIVSVILGILRYILADAHITVVGYSPDGDQRSFIKAEGDALSFSRKAPKQKEVKHEAQ